MTTIVSELVELARGDGLELKSEDVRLDQVVRDATARAQRNAPKVAFALEAEECTVFGVPARLERAVLNLLDNAAKWSEPEQPVEVRVACADGFAVVTVRDHGPGVKERDLPHVFDRFYRSLEDRGRPGSGLGLAIVKQVAESHGGSASLSQPEDGGTLARLALPLAAGAAGGEAPIA